MGAARLPCRDGRIGEIRHSLGTVSGIELTKSAKSTVIPLLTLGGQSLKSVNHYKYLGIVLDTELSNDKDIRDNCDISIA